MIPTRMPATHAVAAASIISRSGPRLFTERDGAQARRPSMALTRQTMTDEQRKSVAIEYLKAFDNGGVTSSGGSILDLFATDAQVYFPKWGMATGRDQIGKLFGDVGGTLKSIQHHFAEFNWVFSGSDMVVCEG